ncbi:MAG: TonB-dependent receptor [Dysgonamonadaceae bacterium]|nr:TonB-dependent receptor [Dysgonamonadaceae bacterium]
MKDTLNLQEVVVAPESTGTLSFRTTVLQAQKIGRAELSRAACCNLSESFETNPSVDVSYSDAVTGAKQIRLLGLDGIYVQLLSENFPIYRGLASIYGLDYVPGPWMESILISKGTSSVKNGYEAITGQINVEYKKPPVSDILTVNLFAADNARWEANGDASFLLNDKLSSGLFVHYSSEQKQMDSNDDGFMDTPLKQQVNLMNRWHYQTDRFISQSGIQYLHDERTGGQIDKAVPADFSKPLYRTKLNVNRLGFFTKNGWILNPEKNESMALIVTGSIHDQNAVYGLKTYDADEKTLYTSFLYEKNFNQKNKISTGISLNYQNVNEESFPSFPGKTTETTTGAYLEYTYNKEDKLIVLAGLRADYSSLFDLFITPRLHLKYNFTEWLHLRGTVGKGYRTPLVLAENQFYLASNRILQNQFKIEQEEAWNYGINLGLYIPVNNNELIVNGEWYYTDFQKQLIVDQDENPNRLSFYNLNGKSYSSVFQVEASYPFFRGFNLTAAFRWMDVRATYGEVLRKKPLTSNHKALVTASYQTPLKKWQFDLTSQFNGGGRMPDPDEINPLWEAHFSAYTILNAQITKNFRDWSIYIGAENIFDYTQESRVIGYDDPYGPNYDATMIWGPVHGRKFYVGLKYNIQRL